MIFVISSEIGGAMAEECNCSSKMDGENKSPSTLKKYFIAFVLGFLFHEIVGGVTANAFYDYLNDRPPEFPVIVRSANRLYSVGTRVVDPVTEKLTQARQWQREVAQRNTASSSATCGDPLGLGLDIIPDFSCLSAPSVTK